MIKTASSCALAVCDQKVTLSFWPLVSFSSVFLSSPSHPFQSFLNENPYGNGNNERNERVYTAERSVKQEKGIL